VALSTQRPIDDAFGASVGLVKPTEDIQAYWSRGMLRDYWERADGPRTIRFIAHGWPLPALYHVETAAATSLLYSSRTGSRGGFEIPLKRRSAWLYSKAPVILPYWPLRTGIVVNTMLYAACWALMFHVPGVACRRLRVWRGRCPACAYDLEGQATPGCPECGRGRS
jgi:hypothetical protein